LIIWLHYPAYGYGWQKASGYPALSYDEVLEVALDYDWIDGRKKYYDDKELNSGGAKNKTKRPKC
jgi:hypothetical protein